MKQIDLNRLRNPRVDPIGVLICVQTASDRLSRTYQAHAFSGSGVELYVGEIERRSKPRPMSVPISNFSRIEIVSAVLDCLGKKWKRIAVVLVECDPIDRATAAVYFQRPPDGAYRNAVHLKRANGSSQ